MLETFLKENLSWMDFESLNKSLDITPKACTQLLNDPKRGNKLQLEKIADLIRKWNPSFKAAYLVQQYKFGKKKK